MKRATTTLTRTDRLTTENRIVVYHTPIFLDETISQYGSPRQNGDWRRHLNFAVDICNGGLYLSKTDIWHEELIMGKGRLARCLFPSRPTRRYRRSQQGWKEQLRVLAETGDLSEEWNASAADREETNQKKNNQKAIFRTVRQEVAQAIREGRVVGPLADASYSQFRRSEFIRMGRLFMDLVDARHAGSVADIWARDPDNFPFYSAFIEGAVYSAFYAAVQHNDPLDRNSQADYEQLAYLMWADMFISDDQRFLRHAFEAIWKPRGKRLLTADEFAALLHAIT